MLVICFVKGNYCRLLFSEGELEVAWLKDAGYPHLATKFEGKLPVSFLVRTASEFMVVDAHVASKYAEKPPETRRTGNKPRDEPHSELMTTKS